MKKTAIFISALVFALIISGPAFAKNITSSDQELGTGTNVMDNIDLSPQVVIEYYGDPDGFAMAGWNLRGSRTFAVISVDNNVYYDELEGDETQPAATDNVLGSLIDELSSDTWKLLGDPNAGS